MTESNYWHRLARSRVSRRRALRGAAVGAAGLAGAALIGCGSNDNTTPTATATATSAGGGGTATTSPTSTATPEQIKRGGTYRGSFTGPFAGVDPHNSVYGGSGIIPQVYNYLHRKEVLRPDVGLKPDLATGHEVSGDGLTWVFKLRTDAMIAPNTQSVPERPLDAEDVVKSMDRIATQENGANGFAFFAEWVDTYDAPDAETFRLVTKKPYAWVEEVFGDNLQMVIVPKEWLAQGTDAMKAMAVGAGPFVLKELTEGEKAVMGPNPNFYDSNLPYLDEYRILAFADVATQRTAFQAHQLDIFGSQDPDEAAQLEKTVSGVTNIAYETITYKSFWMNTKSKPWDDERVRRAMNLSMNRDQYIAIIGKGQGSAMGPLAPAYVGYALEGDELKQAQPYDPNEAKKQFDAAGVSEISFSHPTSSNTNDYVNILVQQLQQIGITAKPNPLDAGTWVAAYFQSQLDASLSLNQQYKTPDFALRWYKTGGITGNGRYDTGYYTPEVDAALEKAASTIPEEERKTAYKDAQKAILASDPAFINFFTQPGNTLIYDNVMNAQIGAGSIENAFVREIWLA